MNKLILTFVGAMALSFTANAVALFSENEKWFDGGIKDGWPTAPSMTGGGWMNVEGSKFESDHVTVSAAAETPLTFTAAVEKVTADYKATISSTVGFTAFEELPAVPADAKAGVIAHTNGYFYVLADNGSGNAWQKTAIEASEEATVDVTFLDPTNVVYTIGGTPVTNKVTEVKQIQNVCVSGDGTLAGLSATAEAKAKPVVPGKDVPVPSGKTQEQFVKDINKDPAEKAKYLKAPDGVTTTSDYLGLFNAAPNGTDKVTFVLNDKGTNAVVEATTDAETNVLAVALSPTATEFIVTTPIRGFYYSLKQGADVTNLTFRLTTDKNKLATDTVNPSFQLVKPEGKGFYNTLVTPAPYEEPKQD